MSVPAGWYPDPAGGPSTRWWNGTQWTDTVRQPYAAAPALTAPEGTKIYNPWIWFVVFLPYATLPFLPFIDFTGMFSSLQSGSGAAEFQLLTSPGFIALSLGGWIVIAAVVLCSWLDWRALNAAGLPKPFHWAWGFASLAGYPIYAIGRAVVTRRRTGRGLAVMWVTIGMFVLTFILSIVWAASLMMYFINSVPGMYT